MTLCKNILFIVLVAVFASACSTKIISNNIYNKNRLVYDSIEQDYLRLYRKNPFAIAFESADFENISLNLKTDSLTKIYPFNIAEKRLLDTLHQYKMDTTGVMNLIRKMKKVKCTWINNYDYYTRNQEHRFVYLSIKPLIHRQMFSPPKYIVLAYFPTPQNFDKNGILLNGRRTKKARKLNGYTFHKLTSNICYTIAEQYR